MGAGGDNLLAMPTSRREPEVKGAAPELPLGVKLLRTLEGHGSYV
jgi:hypothetical protein